jgi:bifunctional non-homologous end joining protein LigD
MEDRAAGAQRFPDGINGEAFYQQKAPAIPPAGVRVETIQDADGDRVDRLVGGSLATLLYQVQLGNDLGRPLARAVSKASGFADYSVVDLDPGPRAKVRACRRGRDVGEEELDRLGLHGALKTSGSTGLHIFLPLPPRTSNEAALLVAQLVATRVANAHPKEATVERSVSARPKATVYVDYLQNVLASQWPPHTRFARDPARRCPHRSSGRS